MKEKKTKNNENQKLTKKDIKQENEKILSNLKTKNRYCENCGNKITKKDTKCPECKSKVNVANNKTKNFANEYITSAGQGRVLDVIYNFIAKHTYAMILSLSFVAAIIAPTVYDLITNNRIEYPKQIVLKDKKEEKQEEKEEPVIEQEEQQEQIEEQKNNQVQQEPVYTPTCQPKKFSNRYTYVYNDEATCIANGDQPDAYDYFAANGITASMYGCERIVDECGTEYWGVYFTNTSAQRFYY